MQGFLLKVVEGGLKGEEYILDQEGLCLVGRDKSCSISIPREKDVGLSRRHCLLIIDPPNLRVRDLFSTNGTYVNAHRLIPAPIGDTPESENPNDRFLLDGDRVSISNTVMEMHVLAEVEATQETSKLSLDNPLQDSQTTKTKVINFAHGKTRANSLIPEPNSIDSDDSGNGIMEETQFFLSLPITEPIPRPNRAMNINSDKSIGTSPLEDENEDSNDKKATSDTTKAKGNKMAEKPNMSIITGNTDSQDKIISADSLPTETNPIEEKEKSGNQSLAGIPSASAEPETVSEEKPVPHLLVKKEDSKAETEAEDRIPPVMPAVPEKSLESEEKVDEAVPEEDPVAEKPEITLDTPSDPVDIPEEKEKELADEEMVEEVDTEEKIEEELPLPEEKAEKKKEDEPEDANEDPSRKRLFDTDKMKAMEELAGALAHDYNKQLTVVMGYTELLKNTKDPDKIREYAETIFRSAQLSSELTEQLMMFASHDHDCGNAVVNLSDMLTEIVSVIKHTAGRKIGVEYVAPFEHRHFYTKGRQLEIHDAILNIAINALDSIRGTGTVSFKIQPVQLSDKDVSELSFPVEPGDFVKISVKDTGSGISDFNFERIFEPFFTTKEKEQALGMGLTVAYGVVKKHKGAIDVDSLSKGTLFDIYLPSSDKSNGDFKEQVMSKEKLQEMNVNVLLIDDEEDMRSLITEMLTLVNTQVKDCLDEIEAIEEYKKDPDAYDLVIVNMKLPMRAESETFTSLKKIKSDVKVLFSSGYKPSTQSQEVIAIGNVAYLPTPYSSDELYDAVYELLK